MASSRLSPPLCSCGVSWRVFRHVCTAHVCAVCLRAAGFNLGAQNMCGRSPKIFLLKNLFLLTPMSSKMSMSFFSSVKKKLRFLMKTFQDFSPYNALCTGNQTVQGPRVSVQLQRALNDSRR